MRHAIVAGQFYPAGKEELKKQIENFFSSLDISVLKDRKIIGGIVPHAGYIFSGKSASYVYKLLKDKFDTFIVLGTNHSGLGSKISLSIDDFDTPLGAVESDISLVEEIVKKKAGLDLEVNETAHKYEHSIEVQLPFLKVVQKGFKIAAILVRDLSIEEIKKFGKIISEIVKKKQERIFILASSDFTHYGRSYGFLPFRENVRENLYKLDEKAIKKIEELDVPGFLNEARKTTICGKDAIACCIEICKNLGCKKGEKLCYYTSGDIVNEWENAVGYASLVFV